MRWVWRAERGASALEYGGLVVLAAALIVALVSAGLSTKVQSSVGEAMCVIMGKDGCKVEAGGPDDEGGGSSPGDGGGSSASPSADPDSDGGGGEPSEDEGENVAYDPELDKQYQDAKKEAKKAEEAHEDSLDYKELGKDLLKLVSEIIGIEDAKKCILEGDIEGCIWTALGLMPWGKVGKVLSKIPKAIKLFKKYRKALKAKNAAKARNAKAKKKLEEAEKACKKRKKPNSFVSGTPVLLSDGRRVDIGDVHVGDEVLATDLDTGTTEAQPVTESIAGTGEKRLVTVTVYSSRGQDQVTATKAHPFWVSEQDRWVGAGELDPGDRLRTAEGATAVVTRLSEYDSQHQTVYNLDIANISTYYIGTGAGPLLVHNEDSEPGDACSPPERPGPGDKPRKVVNTEIEHASDRAVQRVDWLKNDKRGAREELKKLGKSIQKDGFPEGTINDTHADRVLVPLGDKNYVVYQIKPNGNAVVRNVLDKKE